VTVGGVPEPKAATLVAGETAIAVLDEPGRFVGRGGEKLQTALDAFPVSVTGASALDVGASTGGFTDCLLQAGAARVVALDVGYGQLHWRIRSDDRVAVVERTNFRHVDPAAIGAPFDVVVADVSFISVATIADRLAACGHPGTEYVILVKPQFEVGKELVGKGGIVRDPAVHRSAIVTAGAALQNHGIGILDAVPSPVMGAKGNREFLVWGRLGAGGGDLERIAAEAAS
jgi:23S rRNA (cytidine1920-2'-O)/16S rRNA (cytidine1409-2'-O)-methyltransferase